MIAQLDRRSKRMSGRWPTHNQKRVVPSSQDLEGGVWPAVSRDRFGTGATFATTTTTCLQQPVALRKGRLV